MSTTKRTALERIGADAQARAIYDALLVELGRIGAFELEPKLTSIHVVHGRAFLGIAPRTGALRLSIVLAGPLESDRPVKSECLSRNRWHHEVHVASPRALDRELLGWLKRAHALTAE